MGSIAVRNNYPSFLTALVGDTEVCSQFLDFSIRTEPLMPIAVTSSVKTFWWFLSLSCPMLPMPLQVLPGITKPLSQIVLLGEFTGWQFFMDEFVQIQVTLLKCLKDLENFIYLDYAIFCQVSRLCSFSSFFSGFRNPLKTYMSWSSLSSRILLTIALIIFSFSIYSDFFSMKFNLFWSPLYYH